MIISTVQRYLCEGTALIFRGLETCLAQYLWRKGCDEGNVSNRNVRIEQFVLSGFDFVQVTKLICGERWNENNRINFTSKFSLNYCCKLCEVEGFTKLPLIGVKEVLCN